MTEKHKYEVTVTKIRSSEYSDEVIWSQTFYTYATSEKQAKQNVIFRYSLNKKLYYDDYCEEFYRFKIFLSDEEIEKLVEKERQEEAPKEPECPNIQRISIFDDLDDDDDNRYAKPCK